MDTLFWSKSYFVVSLRSFNGQNKFMSSFALLPVTALLPDVNRVALGMNLAPGY